MSADSGIEIRVAGLADAARLSSLAAEIWHQCYSEIISTSQIDYMLEQRFGENRLCTDLAGNKRRYWIVEMGSVPIAYGSLSLKLDAGSVKLEQLYVHASVRRMGIGRTLLDTLLAESKRLGALSVWLTVNRHNGAAIEFYLRTGFVKTGTKVTSIGNGFVMNDFVMKKQLENKNREKSVSHE